MMQPWAASCRIKLLTALCCDDIVMPDWSTTVPCNLLWRENEEGGAGRGNGFCIVFAYLQSACHPCTGWSQGSWLWRVGKSSAEPRAPPARQPLDLVSSACADCPASGSPELLGALLATERLGFFFSSIFCLSHLTLTQCLWVVNTPQNVQQYPVSVACV